MKALTFITLWLLLFISTTSFACELVGEPKVQWRAFKTPAKVGVLGTFTNVERKVATNGAKNLKTLLEGQKVEINTYKISTGNEGRDENIVDNFFKMLKTPTIKATIKKLDAKKKTLNLEVIISGVKKQIPMKYEIKGGKLLGLAHMDLLDFSLGGPLKAINEACYTMHEGKTWSHVELLLTQELKSCQ